MVTTAEQTRSSITIAAVPALVMAAIADFESYPRWAAESTHSEILEPGTDGRAHRVRMHIDTATIRDEQTLRYRWYGDRSVQWTLESSRILHSLDGSYTLTATTPDVGDVPADLGTEGQGTRRSAPPGRMNHHRTRPRRARPSRHDSGLIAQTGVHTQGTGSWCAGFSSVRNR
ncbi:SRPBCC family protein [Amycolatopsis lurida]|uniref:SRPBCC family protein n=1 Tax=Amycolatopsis lurida TaxID=31959 RepID=UPI0018E939BF